MALKYFVLAVALAQVFGDQWPCDRKAAIAAFEKKEAATHYTFNANPYKNQTAESMKKIMAYLKDDTSVCALKYFGPDKKVYETKTFKDEASALEADFIVTHQGRCGACSTLPDLAVYLKQNLTGPVRACGARTISPLIRRCLYGLGFTSTCVDIWEYNIKNTRSKCWWTCIKNWRSDYNKPDGSLNDCLQCDEDNSGPVFKYFAGRTRRNSGIVSAIHRPNSQIYHMNHCYY
eukprot:TCONS_00010370-protein